MDSLWPAMHVGAKILFLVFKSYKDARTPRDHRVLQDKAGSIEWVAELYDGLGVGPVNTVHGSLGQDKSC